MLGVFPIRGVVLLTPCRSEWESECDDGTRTGGGTLGHDDTCGARIWHTAADGPSGQRVLLCLTGCMYKTPC